MTREELWTIYTKKNPQFLEGGVTFTPAGLKKFFEQTWDQGHGQGFRNGQAWEQNQSKEPVKASDPMDIFNSVFRK